MINVLDKAINLINQGEVSFVLIKDNRIIHQDLGIGVSCIMRLIHSQPDLMKNSQVVDKVIGKAASMLLIKYGVRAVYGCLMSENAMDVLEQHQIHYGYQTKVKSIMNRNKDGLCPLEKACLTLDDVDEAKQKIEETIAILMCQKKESES